MMLEDEERKDRLEFYLDKKCSFPIEKFDFGEIDADQTIEVIFYLKNVSPSFVDDIVLKPVDISQDLIVDVLDNKISRLAPGTSTEIRVVIHSYEESTGGRVSFAIETDGKICVE